MSSKASEIDQILNIIKEFFVESKERSERTDESQVQEKNATQEKSVTQNKSEMEALVAEYERAHNQAPIPYTRIVEAIQYRLKALGNVYRELVNEQSLEFRKSIKFAYSDYRQIILLRENASENVRKKYDEILQLAAPKAQENFEPYLRKQFGEKSIAFLAELMPLALDAMYPGVIPNDFIKSEDRWNTLLNFLLQNQYSIDQACRILADLKAAKEKDLIKFEILTDVTPLVESLKGLKTAVSLNESLSHTPNETIFTRYEKAMDTLSGEEVGLYFLDCGLTNTHIFLLCEILKTSVVAYSSGLILTGFQDFDPKYLADQLFDVLSNNPHAVYTLRLPKELEQYENLKKLWTEITADNSARILSFGDASFEPSKGKEKLRI